MTPDSHEHLFDGAGYILIWLVVLLTALTIAIQVYIYFQRTGGSL